MVLSGFSYSESVVRLVIVSFNGAKLHELTLCICTRAGMKVRILCNLESCIGKFHLLTTYGIANH